MNSESDIERLLTIMRRLRDPRSGCPWDLKQTFRTIAPYTLEEAFEVVDAIERGERDRARRRSSAATGKRQQEEGPRRAGGAEGRARQEGSQGGTERPVSLRKREEVQEVLRSRRLAARQQTVSRRTHGQVTGHSRV